MSDINPKQQLFIAEYLKCFNATKAAQAAGYSTPRQQGSRLLSNADIKAALRQAFTENVMTPEEVLMHLSVIARGDIDLVTDNSGNLDMERAREYGSTNLIRKSKSRTFVTEDSDVTENEIELFDRVRALELLAKYHDLLTTRIQIDDWRSQAIADIRAGLIPVSAYGELAAQFGSSLATELFAAAGVQISMGSDTA